MTDIYGEITRIFYIVMKNIIIIFNLLVSILPSQNSTEIAGKRTNISQMEVEVLHHLIRAETWYWMARATSN